MDLQRIKSNLAMKIHIRSFLFGAALLAGITAFFAFRSAPAELVFKQISTVEPVGGGDPRLILEGGGDAETSRPLVSLISGLAGKFGKNVGQNDRTIETAITELTAQGWELVGVTSGAISPMMNDHVTTSGGIITHYLFRKPA